MKIKDVIKMANLMEKGNVLEPELAMFFLSELDGMIRSDIMLCAPEEIVSYDNQEQELLLRKPHDGIYLTYLVAMIRQCQGEFEGYENAQKSVDEKLKTFRRWYIQHYRPADTNSRSYSGGTSADAFGFAYLTAYGLAVKHGYSGTEEEWLRSLEGAPGAAARMRYDADRKMIQWGVEGVWYDLFGLEELKDPVVEALMGAARYVSAAITQHDSSTKAHSDLRLELQALREYVNTLLDSDDTTLDQLSEIVGYIKSNRTLIDAITTAKVSVGDIVNDLMTNVSDRPLSAAMGVELKRMFERLAVRLGVTSADAGKLAVIRTDGGLDALEVGEGLEVKDGRLNALGGGGGGSISASGDGDDIIITTSMTVRADGDDIIFGG